LPAGSPFLGFSPARAAGDAEASPKAESMPSPTAATATPTSTPVTALRFARTVVFSQVRGLDQHRRLAQIAAAGDEYAAVGRAADRTTPPWAVAGEFGRAPVRLRVWLGGSHRAADEEVPSGLVGIQGAPPGT
jgi:hypothetical protein